MEREAWEGDVDTQSKKDKDSRKQNGNWRGGKGGKKNESGCRKGKVERNERGKREGRDQIREGEKERQERRGAEKMGERGRCLMELSSRTQSQTARECQLFGRIC